MTKRKIKVIFNKNLNKKKIYDISKQEVLKIYNSLKENYYDYQKILNITLNLDLKKNNEFRILFLLSLYCSYIHYAKKKHNINLTKLSKIKNYCFKKYNFYIVDIDDSYVNILKNLSVYFNTDANNLEPITGKILADLNNIEVQIESEN